MTKHRLSITAHPNVASLDEARKARALLDPAERVIIVDFCEAEPETTPATATERRQRRVLGRHVSKDAAGYAVALGQQKRVRAAQNAAAVAVAEGPPRHRYLNIAKIAREIAREKARDARWWRKWLRAVLGLGRRSRRS